MRSVFFSAAVVSLLALACSDGSGPPTAGPPASVTAVAPGPLEGTAGTALATPLAVKVTDSDSRAVVGALVHFTIPLGGGSLSAASDTTDAQGVASVIWTLGQSLGATRAEARVAGVLVPAVFNATIKAGAPAQMQRTSNPPGSSAAGFELADSVAIRLTDNFGNPVGGTEVTFAVASGGGTVNPATATTSTTGVARASWKLGSVGPQQLRATAGAVQTLVDASAASCIETQIAPGSVLTLGPTDPKCVVLSGNASRYFVTVVNTDSIVASAKSFRIRGLGAGTAATSGDVVQAPVGAAKLAPAWMSARLEELRERADAHDAIRRANERVIQQLAPQTRSARAALRIQNTNDPVAPPNVGDTINLRIPNVNNLCSLQGSTPVRARVVFVGQRSVMLEDVTNTSDVTGTIDTLYAKVGQEFDTNMWNLLSANFGNPLAMDPQTDNNGRFYMLFSRFISTIQGGGIAGFVASSDFFPQSDCAASNLAEIFYARAPTEVSGGVNVAGSPAEWYWRTRTVMMHEVKHIVSFAERLANPNFSPPEGYFDKDRWLEESSAMLAEELWARGVYGYSQLGNTEYRMSLGCERRINISTDPNYAHCIGNNPLSMFDHYLLLRDYLTNVEGLSPIGASLAGDFSFYGSGWNFLRWVVDTYGTSESAFLTALTREIVLPGVQNVEARAGRTFADLVNDWAIALVMDDYPGFTPSNPKHKMPSWNQRDIFSEANRELPSLFAIPFPLRPRATAFGKFSVDVSSVRGGSMAVFEVTGTQTDRQLFEFNGNAGASFPADMRVNIIRVQ